MTDRWDCVVVGGGAAGLSAALVLGRSRRTTLVIDAGRQSNLAAHGPPQLDAAQTDRLRGAGITIDERDVAELRGPGHELTAVVFADGTERTCGGMLVPVQLHQRSPLAWQLGACSRPATQPPRCPPSPTPSPPDRARRR